MNPIAKRIAAYAMTAMVGASIGTVVYSDHVKEQQRLEREQRELEGCAWECRGPGTLRHGQCWCLVPPGTNDAL